MSRRWMVVISQRGAIPHVPADGRAAEHPTGTVGSGMIMYTHGVALLAHPQSVERATSAQGTWVMQVDGTA